MDERVERLFRAARTGNVDELHRLLSEDLYILLRVASVSAETPLHLASMAGHLDFVKDIIKQNPEFARELNQDGLCPIHLASANGYVEIVKELLTTINCDDQQYCRLQSNRDKKTPLHYAVVKGRTDVINELISSCKECLEDVTMLGETALHLAVKNNQLDALKVMVERLKELNKEDILNVKDEEGNTVLHLATSMKQREVLKLLLPVNDMGTSTGTGAVEVNAVNICNLTALDLLLLLPNESSDRRIEEILRRAGAKRAKELAEINNVQVLISAISNYQATITSLQADDSTTTRTRSARSALYHLYEFFEFKKGKESAADIRGALLVITVLITTATYQAVLSPPGGLWQDDQKNTVTPGRSILGTTNPRAFKVFLISNSVGFFSSWFMIAILMQGFPLRLELYICFLAMLATYATAMGSITPKGNDGLSNLLKFSGAFMLVISVAAPVLRLSWMGLREMVSWVSGCRT